MSASSEIKSAVTFADQVSDHQLRMALKHICAALKDFDERLKKIEGKPTPVEDMFD